ncbi:carboxypeptidase regulatory-like domain-containing protein [Candidatus Roizmanbacteria bacterium]|nr:carboxypeptidase regulatory-like domain-containing protein [Candidatus Roizmanbacteria bacterium]
MSFKIKIILTSFLIIFLSFPFLLTKPAFADNFNLSGSVKDSSGNAITGAIISVNDTNNDSATTDSSGNYSLSIPQGIYDVQVMPPSGSGLTSAIAYGQNISSIITLNFILTPTGTVTFSGHLYDGSGNPITNMIISLNGSNGTTSMRTTSTGNYSLQVPNGTYTIKIGAQGPQTGYPAGYPDWFYVQKNNYVLNQSTIVDLTLPIKHVTMHIQDSSGNPVGGVKLTDTNDTLTSNQNITIGSGITNASLWSKYYTSSSAPQTDSSTGNATLLLFPNDSSSSYNFTGTPPSGSGFVSTAIPSFTISGDANETGTLQTGITLSGYLYDESGNPINNMLISLSGSNGTASMRTTITGSYSLLVASGTYKIEIGAQGPQSGYPTGYPDWFDVRELNYSLTQNTNLDLTLPVRKVIMHVQDASGNPVGGVKLTDTNDFLTSNQDANIGGGITNASLWSRYYSSSSAPQTDYITGNATLFLFPNDSSSSYHFVATPPSGSGFATTTVPSFTITTDTTEIATIQKPVTLSGHVYDGNGNPIPSQTISLTNSSGAVIYIKTDASTGSYSLPVMSGSYTLEIGSNGLQSNPQYFPAWFDVVKRNYSINQNTNLDITLPLKQVIMHVQDVFGNPIGGVAFDDYNDSWASYQDFSIGGGITDASVTSKYISNSSPKTDPTTGNVTLLLFPTDSNSIYNFTAIPQSGSNYKIFTLNNIVVTGDQTELISLQYNHANPVTTIDLATQHVDGTYSNPTTVTLGATAAAGYTIANTYFTVDGGTQQTYTVPFEVSSAGNHTITYWSVDNSGVPETHSTKNFTIYSNQAPYVNPLSGGSVNVGQAYTENGSFTDSDSTSWTAIVDYGEGAGPEALIINPDKTFTLNHQYNTAGSYTVTVVVTDNQHATGTTMTTVNVNAPATIGALSGTTLNEGQTYTETGSFTDPDSTSWTGKVNYGDGALDEPLTLNSDKTFSLNHLYKDNGTYNVTVSITDNQGVVATQNTNIIVNNLTPIVSTIIINTTPVQINNPINASATFTDQGILDTHTATWNWGDGSTTNGTVLELNGSGSVSDNHTYTTTGVYLVTLTITDKDGGKGANTYSYVAVYDPNGGFVTGSGKIMSSQGSMPGNSSATGKSEFGIEAKYDNTNNPKGHIKFSFENGNIDFESTSYDYVVVAGNTAYIIGYGKLNGVNAYTFLASVIDGSPDKFRIKITDANGLTIYDNQMNATDITPPINSISSGNIKIH